MKNLKFKLIASGIILVIIIAAVVINNARTDGDNPDASSETTQTN